MKHKYLKAIMLVCCVGMIVYTVRSVQEKAEASIPKWAEEIDQMGSLPMPFVILIILIVSMFIICHLLYTYCQPLTAIMLVLLLCTIGSLTFPFFVDWVIGSCGAIPGK